MNLGKLFQVGGAAVAGYGEDKRRMIAEELSKVAAKRQAAKDAIDAAIAQRTLRTPVFGDDDYFKGKEREAGIGTQAAVDQARQLSPITTQTAVNTAAGTAPIDVKKAIDIADGTAPVQQTTHRANRAFDVANPLPVTPSIGTATVGGDATTPGKVITYDQHTGKPVGELGDAKTPGNTGAATITKAIATNKTQLAIIDDALRELDAHPDAVGLTRGLPIIGDRLDPRADPTGVAARAQIANIGSLKIHDRSGAAVSVHEFPRLAPFIPAVSDPPAAIRVKLQKLRDAIEVETAAMQPPVKTPGGDPSGSGHGAVSDSDFARAWAAGKRTDADIAAWVAANPKGP